MIKQEEWDIFIISYCRTDLLSSSGDVEVTSVYRLAVHKLLPTKNGETVKENFIALETVMTIMNKSKT